MSDSSGTLLKDLGKPIYNEGIGEFGGYAFEDISFYNTSLITEAARYFKKYGKYPYPPPQPKDATDKNYYRRFQETKWYSEYKAYWDEEENRRRNGIVIPGRLLPTGEVQKIHISGHHYSYLNYTQILHEDSNREIKSENTVKKLPKFARRVGESRMEFPDFWDGDYHFFKTVELAEELGMNVTVDKTRQSGYSYKNSTIASDEYDLIPNSTTVIGAFDEKYLSKGDATFEMAKKRINFLNTHTDWKKEIMGRGTGSADIIRSGYYYKQTKSKGGYGSLIIPVTFQDNPDAARGKKGRKVFMEEAGKFPNLSDSVIATQKGLMEGDIVTGIMIIFGTGGGKPGNWEDFYYIFYHPLEYRCLPFVNKWDEAMGHTTCGFFHGRQMNLKPFYDKDGNSDSAKAAEAIKVERELWKKSGKEDYYKKNVAEQPICPSESFDVASDNIFNSPVLVEHKNRVANDPDLNYGQHGKLLHIGGRLRFVPNNELEPEYQHPPILTLDRKADADIHGCITIWDYPYRDREGNIPDKLYYIVHDPYAVSVAAGEITHKHSLGCAYVYQSTNNFIEGFGDKLVAKLMGRPTETDTYNEQLFKLAEFYNATKRGLWFESNRGADVQSYAKRFKKESYLNFETEIDSDKQVIGIGKIKKYGINISTSRKLAAIKYLREWLYRIRSVNENGDEILNLHTILDIRLLSELQRWNNKGNFDAVSTMFVLMFLEKHIVQNESYAQQEELRFNKTTQDALNPSYLIQNLK